MGKKKGKRKAAVGDLATNRQAAFRYHFLEQYECGIVLWGTEVKSARAGRVQLKDGFATVQEEEVLLHNVHIAEYPPASRENHPPERTRKLLLHKREIERLIGKTKESGLTLVPTRMYVAGRNIKVEIALARGKAEHDKREVIRKREADREMARALRYKQ